MPLTNASLSPTEAIIDAISIHDHHCYGCLKTGTDFMISALVSNDRRRDGNSTIYDLFLTRAQVEALHDQIGIMLGRVEKRPTTTENP